MRMFVAKRAGSAEERARWLMEFARCRLADLTAKEKLALDRGVRALIVGALYPHLAKLGARASARLFKPASPYSPAELQGAQEFLREGFKSIKQHGFWAFEAKTPMVAAVPGTTLYRPYYPFADEWRAAVGETLARMTEARRIRLCERCQEPFIRFKNGRYCSATCMRAVHTNRWRAKNRDKVNAAARRAYERRQREAKGNKNLKVGRRNQLERTGE